MRKILLLMLIFVSCFTESAFGWGYDFFISCAQNSWTTDYNNVAQAWKFGGSGNNSASGSTNKVLTLTCVDNPTNPGEIKGGEDFAFKIVTKDDDKLLTYFGGEGDNSNIPVPLNTPSTIKCLNHGFFKYAYFPATSGKTYQILFQSNPVGDWLSVNNITVLEFDGATANTLTHVSNGFSGGNVTINISTGSTEPPADQKYWARYVWDNNWDNPQYAAFTMSGTTGSASISYNSSAASISYYLITSESSITPSNSNVNQIILWLNNNGGLNYNLGELPVELSSFTAAVSKNVVNLEWATATEINNYGFEVEKSADKTNWNKIGFVNGNGNSNSVKYYSYSDKDNTTNGTVYYRLKQLDNNGGYEYSNVVEANINMPVKFELGQNFPNPFNPTTKINYSIPEASSVKLTIYNAIGQVVNVVNDGYKSAGSYTLEVDGSRFNSGVYFYKLEAGNNTQIRKMILVK